MDSSNWRVKRDSSNPSTPTKPREQFSSSSRNQQTDQNSRWGNQRNQSGFESPARSSQQNTYGYRKPQDDAKADKALDEGRRLYFGNLPYEATSGDLVTVLEAVADKIESIAMSVDPMTRRNPSYCFVDFTSKEYADFVMQEYNSKDLLGRPLKIAPGRKSGTGTGPFDVKPRTQDGQLESNQERNASFPFDRWRRSDNPQELEKAVEEGRRVHVAGLPKFDSQAEDNAQVRRIFDGFKVTAIGKMIPIHKDKRVHDKFCFYCFLDLETAEEAQRAIEALNGTEHWGWPIKVSPATGAPRKLHERERLFVGGLPEFSDEEVEGAMRELFTGFELSSISKLIRPRDTSAGTDRHCFCFVDMADKESADRAREELDWKEIWGRKIRVKPATSSRRG